MQSRGELILIVLVLALGGLAIGSTLLNATGLVVFSGGGPGNSIALDSGSVVDLYYRYTQLFDFFLFLLFFLGITQMVLGKHFQEIGLHKAVYVSVGLFLALALVLWEYRTGHNLLELSGPFVLVILFIAFLLLFFQLLKGFGTIGPVSIAGTYMVFYILFFILFDVYQVTLIDTIRYYLPFDLFSIMTILAAVAAFILIGALLSALFRRNTT